MKVRVIYILLFLLSSILLNGQTVNISGLVISSPLSNPIDNANIKILNPSTNEELASTTTNNEGLYSIDFIITNIPIESRVPNNYFLSNAYPNPFNPSTNINFTTPTSGRFTIDIYNIIGERIYSNSYDLDIGGSRFNISGLGSAGVYFLRISNKDFTNTTKLMLLDGGNNNTIVKLLSGGESNSSLSKITSIDSILVRFIKDEFDSKDTTISVTENIIANTLLKQYTIIKIASLDVKVIDQYTTNNIEGASVIVKQESTDSTMAEGLTDVNGKVSFNLDYTGYDGDNYGKYNNIGEIKIIVTNNNYSDGELITPFGNSMSKGISLQKDYFEIQFNLHYVDIVDGIALTDADIVIKWPDDSIKTYVNNNGVINVSKILTYLDNSTKAEMWHNNLDDYLHWVIGRTYELNQYGKEPIFQNDDWENNAFFYIDQLNKLQNAYVGSIDREVEWAFGDPLQTDGYTIMHMMARSPGCIIHTKPQPGIYKIRNVQIIENLLHDEITPNSELDRAAEQIQAVIDAYRMPNGIILEEHEPIKRLSIHSQEWADIKAQDFENTNWTYFGGSGSNYVEVTSVPEPRKKYSSSKYNSGHPNSQILEEILAQYTCTQVDGPYHTYTTEGGELTPVAFMMLRTMAWMRTLTWYAK